MKNEKIFEIWFDGNIEIFKSYKIALNAYYNQLQYSKKVSLYKHTNCNNKGIKSCFLTTLLYTNF